MQPRIVVKNALEQVGRAAVAFEVPLAVSRHVLIGQRPGVERLTAQGAGQLVRAHRHIAGTRRQWTGFDSHAAVEKHRIVAADTIYDLSDLEQAQSSRPAG